MPKPKKMVRPRHGANKIKIDPKARLKGIQRGGNKYGTWTARVYEK